MGSDIYSSASTLVASSVQLTPFLQPQTQSASASLIASMQKLKTLQFGPYRMQSAPTLRGDHYFMRATRADRPGVIFDVTVFPKQISLQNFPSIGMNAAIENELWIRRHLPENPHISLAVDALETSNCHLLVSEFHDFHFDMLKLIATKGRFAESHAKHLFKQLVETVAFCHSNNVVHRDIKLPVIYLDASLSHLWLGGFRFGEVLASKDFFLTDRRGSPAYVSPEMLMCRQYRGQPADVWSLGVILFIMLCGAYPFVDKDPHVLFDKIKHGKLSFPSHLSTTPRSLLLQILDRNPNTRITATDILNHAWFSEREDQAVPLT